MHNNDPYAPPRASLDGTTPSEQLDLDNGVLRYSTVWQRLGAGLIDFLILFPLIALEYFRSQSRLFDLYTLIPKELLGFYFYVYLVVRYGGTPGKRLMGLRIVKLDGAAVTFKTAIKRYFVAWILAFAFSVLSIIAALGMTDEAYLALDYFSRSDALDAQSPHIMTVTWAMGAWYIACLVVMLVDSKRRALHDFIAGTVVVRK